MNLRVILRALGVTVSDEDITAVEALIPMIPGYVRAAVDFIKTKATEIEHRQDTIEAKQDEILRLLYGQRTGTEPATQHRIDGDNAG